MNKELVKRLLESTNINMTDLGVFISEYTENQLHRNIEVIELQGIIQAIQMGVFNLRFALLKAATILDLNVITAFDQNGILLKTHVYENLK